MCKGQKAALPNAGEPRHASNRTRMRRKAALVAHIEEHLANADKRFPEIFLAVEMQRKKRRKRYSAGTRSG
jgi:hypothetical protein